MWIRYKINTAQYTNIFEEVTFTGAVSDNSGLYTDFTADNILAVCFNMQ